MKTEALKLALEALCKMIPCDDVCSCSGQQAIAAIKAALAQPEQEPVAWLTRYISGELDFDEPNSPASATWSAAFPVYEVVTHGIKDAG